MSRFFDLALFYLSLVDVAILDVAILDSRCEVMIQPGMQIPGPNS